MNTPPPTQQASRSSTGALSQQPTLVPATMPPPTEAFTKALYAFRRRLSAEELDKFKNTTYEELVEELVLLQKKQEKNKEMVNLARIQAFLEGMQQLGKTIEVFLNINEVVCFVWGPVKFLLLVRPTSTYLIVLTGCNSQLAFSLTRSKHYWTLMHRLESNYPYFLSMSRCSEAMYT
jgi:transposase